MWQDQRRMKGGREQGREGTEGREEDETPGVKEEICLIQLPGQVFIKCGGEGTLFFLQVNFL